MQLEFEPGETAYVRRNAPVDDAGEEVVGDPEHFRTVVQEVLVLEIRGAHAVVAHSGGRHRYHVDWLLADPDGPEEVKPRAWNP
ncbi:MAG: hypothetical protein ABEJ74_03310 [Haloferacaceae archaeon]